jgi:RNA polymerase sigma factor (sigma-70 family)
MRDDAQLRLAIDRYADTVKRICYIYLKNDADTEDVFQDVFLKYALFPSAFSSEEHEKAWLIRITINRCKDVLKSFFHKKVGSLEEARFLAGGSQAEHPDLLPAVMALPEKYRVVIFLYYYEGYAAPAIAKMLHKKENTIYTNLARAKEQLRTLLGGDYLES